MTTKKFEIKANLDELKDNFSKYRINSEEYQTICNLLGREPEGVEWALFSALWSEHCSYKSSRRHLKKFFAESDRLVTGFGENAGVIDLGQGERVAFKMESHNHPSFIEPYQGAATGVGGILRDIFTMGARPIALANYLCFGEPSAHRMSALVQGVVSGISGYGNCVGVPNISGQTEFHTSYDENILVNAFALGYFGKRDIMVTSDAKGEGNFVVYVGAKTGRDGIHGASMASESFEDGDESKRPTIQIGDPFFEKLLIESCIDVINQNLVVAIQDMGAAGLTSSSFEMASKGNVGLDLYLDQVPLRDPTMSPEDILLSESQERMLLVCEPDKLEAIQKVFSKWNLDAHKIGTVNKERVVRLNWHGEVICEIDPHTLTENSPHYDRKYSPDFKNSENKVKKENWEKVSFNQDLLDRIYSSNSLMPRNWIYDQYDQRVGASTARDCREPIGVVVLPESSRALGIVLGCRPYLMRMSAYVGSQDSVYFPALELACKGFEPLAVTDCLNYGNPEKQNVMTDFVASVEGMSIACESLKTPVISGNVSFYNETRGQNITPTPSTGLVGLGGNPSNIPKTYFEEAGDLIYRISTSTLLETQGKLGEVLGNRVKFDGEIETQAVSTFTKSITEISRGGLVKASKTVGEFGVFNTLYKMTWDHLGFDIDMSLEESLAERLYEVVMVISKKEEKNFVASLKKHSGSLNFDQIGQVKEGSFIHLNPKTKSFKEMTIEIPGLKRQRVEAWSKAFPELN